MPTNPQVSFSPGLPRILLWMISLHLLFDQEESAWKRADPPHLLDLRSLSLVFPGRENKQGWDLSGSRGWYSS